MALLGKLAVAVVGDVQQLKKSFAETKKEITGLDKEVKKHGLGLQQVAKYATIAGAAVVGAMGAMALSVAKSAEQIDLLAKRTGESRETLQGLAYAAQQEGTSIEALGVGLARLARNMDDAAKGTGEAKDTFKALGISVRDSSGHLRKTSDVLMDIADQFKGMNNEAEMTAAAMDLLGRGAQDLVPFLRMGGDEIQRLIAEAQALGYVIDEEAVIQFEAFGDAVDALKTGLAGFSRQIAADIIPYARGFVSQLVEIVKWFHGLPDPVRKVITVGTLFAGVLALIGGGLTSLIAKIAATKVALATLGASFTPFLIGGGIIAGLITIVGLIGRMKNEARLAKLEIGSITSLADAMAEKDRLERDIRSLEALQKAAERQRQQAKKSGITDMSGYASIMSDAERKRLEEDRKRLDALNKQIEKLMKGEGVGGGGAPGDDKWDLEKYLHETEKALNDVDRIAKAFGDTSQVNADKAAIFRDAIIDLIKRGFDPTKTSLGDLVALYEKFAGEAAVDERIKAAQSEIQVYDDLSAAYKRFSDERAAFEQREADAQKLLADATKYLADMTAEALPEWEEFARHLEEIAAGNIAWETAEALKALAAQIRATGQAMEQEPQDFAEAWEAGLNDVAKDSKTYLEHIRDIASTTAQAMSSGFSDFFFDAVTGQLKQLSDYATAIFHSIARAWANMMGDMLVQSAMSWLFPGSGFGGGRAAGGPVSAGTAYLVGERGPELFVPGQSGSIVPHGGANVQVNVINQTGVPVTARQETHVDAQGIVVDLVLDAVARDVHGIRSVLMPARG